MVKLIVCVKRKPGMSVQEFHDYWRTKHGPLVKSVPGCRKYIRNTCSATPSAAYERKRRPFDGIAELWFDSLADVDRFLADPEYLAKGEALTNSPSPIIPTCVVCDARRR